MVTILERGDEVDKASSLSYIDNEYLVNKVRAKADNIIPPTKECLICGDESIPGGKFCSVECRDEYDRRVKFKLI